MADTADCLARVDALLAHPDFTLKNPNKVGALIGVFAGNLRRFHVADGAGYCWLADRILEVFVRPLCLCANCGRHSLSCLLIASGIDPLTRPLFWRPA